MSLLQFLSPFQAMDSPSPKLTLAIAVQHGVLASVALPPLHVQFHGSKADPEDVFLWKHAPNVQ